MDLGTGCRGNTSNSSSCLGGDPGGIQRLDDVLHLLRCGSALSSSSSLYLPTIFNEESVLLPIADVIFRAQNGCLGQEFKWVLVMVLIVVLSDGSTLAVGCRWQPRLRRSSVGS